MSVIPTVIGMILAFATGMVVQAILCKTGLFGRPCEVGDVWYGATRIRVGDAWFEPCGLSHSSDTGFGYLDGGHLLWRQVTNDGDDYTPTPCDIDGDGFEDGEND